MDIQKNFNIIIKTGKTVAENNFLYQIACIVALLILLTILLWIVGFFLTKKNKSIEINPTVTRNIYGGIFAELLIYIRNTLEEIYSLPQIAFDLHEYLPPIIATLDLDRTPEINMKIGPLTIEGMVGFIKKLCWNPKYKIECTVLSELTPTKFLICIKKRKFIPQKYQIKKNWEKTLSTSRNKLIYEEV